MDLIKTIKNYIYNNEPDEPRKYIGASSIGKPCMRQIWYSYQGETVQKREPESQITFEIGHRLEEMMLDYLKKSGVIVICQGKFYQDNSVFQLQGHVDGVITIDNELRAILELKTAKESSFNKFKQKGLKEWCKGYYSQLQCYMGMSGISRGVLLAINKNSSEMHQEWVDFDNQHYELLKLKAQSIITSQSPPPKISDNGSYYICKQCEFRKTCHVQ